LGFWQHGFAAGWETGSFTTLNTHLDPARDYIDIGAWVGPLTLWAAGLARRVVAVEPDPHAVRVLRQNVSLNGLRNVSVLEAAVADVAGTVSLDRQGAWGDSMSSLTDRGGAKVEVAAVRFSDVVAGTDPALVKIDIEGGEGVVLPAAADELHALGCPVLLGVHWPWIEPDRRAAVDEFIRGYTVTVLGGTTDFPDLLLVPN
jgi:FkbM family methyltransferase